MAGRRAQESDVWEAAVGRSLCLRHGLLTCMAALGNAGALPREPCFSPNTKRVYPVHAATQPGPSSLALGAKEANGSRLLFPASDRRRSVWAASFTQVVAAQVFPPRSPGSGMSALWPPPVLQCLLPLKMLELGLWGSLQGQGPCNNPRTFLQL